MSLQEIRSDTINSEIPKLIKALTGFERDNEHFREIESFAFNFVRNYRSLSTNSHEVRRKIEGIQEKFRVANYGNYAEYFGNLCNSLIGDPTFKNYDTDLVWSILQFLLELARNPVASLRHNKESIPIRTPKSTEDDEDDESIKLLKEELRNENITFDRGYSSDSELSVWSDEENVNMNEGKTEECITSVNEKMSKLSLEQTVTNVMHPPEKQNAWVTFETDSHRSEDHLCKTIQHSWWMRNFEHYQQNAPSDYLEANFAVVHSRFLNEISKNYLRIPEPSIVSEDNLIQEIIWMFCVPKNCKFFIKTNNEIRVRENITISSATENGLGYYLNSNFVPFMTMLHNLSRSLENILTDEKFTRPKTVQVYAYNMRKLLESVQQELIDYDNKMTPGNSGIRTLLRIRQDFMKIFETIETLHDIHKNVSIETDNFPPHIASAYLLSSLLLDAKHAVTSQRANISMGLFLASIKVFFDIMDIWWTEGCFIDDQQEFVVEHLNGVGFVMREYIKNKQKSFFVPAKISKRITECSFFKLLVKHSSEAGVMLHLLYEINRIGDLSATCTDLAKNLYNQFMDDVILNLLECGAESEKQEIIEKEIEEVETSVVTTKDEFLQLLFRNPLKKELVKKEKTEKYIDVCDILNYLKSTESILPYQEVTYHSLDFILKKRIAIGNSFVIKLYLEEFMIVQHLRNIRSVFMFEANDLMQRFYEKLFKQIESLESWANPFLLTTQLEDIVCSKYPGMASMFNFDIKSYSACRNDKVYEVVDQIALSYNTNRVIAYIISDDDIKEYNKVFCTLLKVKWGIMTLENLRFPRFQKRAIPYAPFTMMDFIMRRLEQLRFWMIYAMQSIHFHLMTQVLQSMGDQFERSIGKCANLSELQMLHKSYVKTVVNHCLLNEEDSPVRIGLEQILQLAFIVRLEWNDCILRMDDNNPLAIDITDSDNADDENFLFSTNAQMDTIEATYIRCHQYLANRLSKEVFLNGKGFLSTLSAAFNTSVPY